MRGMRPFSALARVYDRMMADVPYAAWAAFVLSVLAGEGAYPRSVLDLGTGTGASLEPFCAYGLTGMGLDASEAMLARARERLPGVPFVQGDFRTFQLERRFDLIVSVFDSLNNLTDPRDLRTTFQRIHAHLRPGGWFAADLNTPLGLEELWEDGVWEGEGYRLVHRYDTEQRLGHIEATILTPEGPVIEHHVERGYWPDEVAAWLSAAGFGRVRCLEYPDAALAGRHSLRFWVFAQRPNGSPSRM